MNKEKQYFDSEVFYFITIFNKLNFFCVRVLGRVTIAEFISVNSYVLFVRSITKRSLMCCESEVGWKRNE